jgi:hypothetical protein
MLALALLDLTLIEILGDLPRDAGAVVAYLMIGLFIALTVVGSRRRSSDSDPASPEP